MLFLIDTFQVLLMTLHELFLSHFIIGLPKGYQVG